MKTIRRTLGYIAYLFAFLFSKISDGFLYVADKLMPSGSIEKELAMMWADDEMSR